MATDMNGPICTCRPEGRNLVVCIDGTSNQFGENNTNVIELYNLIVKGKQQRTYYNSGVGTFANSSWLSWTSWSQAIDNKLDQAVAKNFDHIILGAYRWLSEVYKGPKDKIYLFGFSRGAYQVRCLAGMIKKVGLLHRGNEEQIPFAYELYSKDIKDSLNRPFADQFRKTFCRTVEMIHFVGVWDTVSSVGVVRDNTSTLPLTNENDHICFFRHALALDEERVKFLPEYVRKTRSAPEATVSENGRPPRVKEVWFPGRHSDVGGGNCHNESLSIGGIALHWMAYEALCCGLDLEPPTLNLDRYEDFFDKIPPSVTWKWWALEYVPFTRSNYGSDGGDTKRWPPNRSNGRIPVPGQKVFFTVLQKTADGEMRPYTSRADFSKLSKRFKNWEDVVNQAFEVGDSLKLLDEWKDVIEPDPLLSFNTTGVTQKEWNEQLTPLERRKLIYEIKACFSSRIAQWGLCDPWNVNEGFSNAALETCKVYFKAILDCHAESVATADKPLKFGPQARLVSSYWNLHLEDLKRPRAIKNFPESDFDWLRRVINDETLSKETRVLGARILSCTFAIDLGRALMYLVRSPGFLTDLGDMHNHEQGWIRDRALDLVLRLFGRVPDVSLIQETRTERQWVDNRNSLKAWAVAIAQDFLGKDNDEKPDSSYIVAKKIMSKFLMDGESLLGPRQREIFADLRQEHNQDAGDFDVGADIEEVPATLSDIMSLGDVADAVMDAIYEQPVSRLRPGWRQRTAQFHENWGNIDDLATAFVQWKSSSSSTSPDPPITTPRQPLPTDVKFDMEVIDMFTRETTLHVTLPDDETIVPHLIVRGYLPTTPINPLVAISLRTLQFYKVLRQRKPSFSIEAFTKVLCDLYEHPYRRRWSRVFSNAFEVYLSITRAIDKRVNATLNRCSENWRVLNACPACMYELEGEPSLRYRLQISMDGNDSQKRMKDKGTAGDTRELDDSDYIIPTLEVD
ncbi:hypothetical protein EST38_g5445 [Candolleomyces aberdarensis]|uniref:T6SS Phospholipase effector Tle1-like catalytic domain-containing protein n=1 Tax=Candolleomyces aberdarensis TaxID=2316362 RepID=A0A4Q2DKE0_9AGAR|nr:hypothetical protein EST38_g5445 [Candolleomyces aberdarensis]